MARRARGRQAPPTDRLLDRRLFLERMAVLTAAAAGGAVVAPSTAGAAERAAFAGVRARALLPDARDVQESEPWRLTLAEAAALLRDGKLSPVELLDAHLERIARLDGLLMAFNTVTEELARARPGAAAGGCGVVRPAPRDPPGDQGQLLHGGGADDRQLPYLRRLRAGLRRHRVGPPA